MKIFIKEINGDHNLDVDLNWTDSFRDAVAWIKHQGGYYLGDREKQEFYFIPFHRIEYIRGEGPDSDEIKKGANT